MLAKLCLRKLTMLSIWMVDFGIRQTVVLSDVLMILLNNQTVLVITVIHTRCFGNEEISLMSNDDDESEVSIISIVL